MADTLWPSLRVQDWTETRDTLHRWMQIVGKVRMANEPLVNHWWQVTLYVSARGLTTGSVPYRDGTFDIEFDFIDHRLVIRSSTGDVQTVPLVEQSVARFYEQTIAAVEHFGIATDFQAAPNEVEAAIPFAEDETHASYDPEAAQLFWRQLIAADRTIGQFRAHFVGKVSPVHFFWGAMDLACTRFSGRTAPEHPGGAPNCGDWVMVEGYSRELSSCGFWPGGGEEGAFYSYAYPAPDGFADATVGPEGAFYSEEFQQFLLPYEVVRTAADPEAAVAEFLQSVYEAAADLGDWDREMLEDHPERWSHQSR